jgi:hypothetical protein
VGEIGFLGERSAGVCPLAGSADGAAEVDHGAGLFEEAERPASANVDSAGPAAAGSVVGIGKEEGAVDAVTAHPPAA